MPKKKKRRYNKKFNKIDIEQLILQARYVYLFREITDHTAYETVTHIVGLSKLDEKKPICLYINSPGGCVDSGFAIIDAIQFIPNPVYTFISGMACSMAGVISIAGDKRYMSENSVWMSHDMSGGIYGDYTSKVIARAEYLKESQAKLFKFIQRYTKLNPKDINKAIHEELWLNSEQCLKKGVIDEIIKI